MRGGELESYWIESRLCVTVNFCYAIVNKAGCLGSNYCSRGETLIAVNLSEEGGRARDSSARVRFHRRKQKKKKIEPGSQRATARSRE